MPAAAPHHTALTPDSNRMLKSCEAPTSHDFPMPEVSMHSLTRHACCFSDLSQLLKRRAEAASCSICTAPKLPHRPSSCPRATCSAHGRPAKIVGTCSLGLGLLTLLVNLVGIPLANQRLPHLTAQAAHILQRKVCLGPVKQASKPASTLPQPVAGYGYQAVAGGYLPRSPGMGSSHFLTIWAPEPGDSPCTCCRAVQNCTA